MAKKKRLLTTMLYIAIALSVALNLVFAASLALDINVRKCLVKFKNILILTNIPGLLNNVPGRWRLARTEGPEQRLTPEQKKMIKKLESVGYLTGSKLAPQVKSVTAYNKELAYNGLNLIISGHGPEAILADMQGRELHRWSYDYSRIQPDYEPPKHSENHQFWRRAHLFENGDLLAIFEGLCLIRLDKDSNLLWVYHGGAHHDLFIAGDGKIYVLTREAKIDPKYNKDEPLLEDFISVLDPQGSELRRVSVLKSLENSNYARILDNITWITTGPRQIRGDILHTNTIELLDGRLSHRSKAFREGNVLISILQLNTICIVDLDEKSVVWSMSGLWRRQHQPTILANGNMLLFDNNNAPGQSEVIEFDPFTQQVLWSYTGTTDGPFYTPNCGSSERLPNGNTLITESNNGRAFEVTPDKTIVWEFYSPYRAGKNNEFVATLLEVIRLGPDFPLDWLGVKAKHK